VVVFAILLKAVEAGSLTEWLSAEGQTGWYILWATVRLSLLGPLLGAVLGVLSVKWLQINGGTDNDANVEVGNIPYVDR